MGERLPEGWVDLSLNERLMEHPGIEVRSRSEFGKFGKFTTTCAYHSLHLVMAPPRQNQVL